MSVACKQLCMSVASKPKIAPELGRKSIHPLWAWSCNTSNNFGLPSCCHLFHAVLGFVLQSVAFHALGTL